MLLQHQESFQNEYIDSPAQPAGGIPFAQSQRELDVRMVTARRQDGGSSEAYKTHLL
jgi:hypothetical protein